ncbi:LOW QUALITY PROTEIN: TBC1 domain family member 22B [Drosophila ficusphila]|uniref:LOW QUALITY PROTEIN: TBC1 domain family member 22B n=1 Tax=Drosophila ficusphila TaxID=30025 RepID=UPI0007E6DE6D|nr:LOW QUALITY PROTEIN: TBC1 domain family member 22B [Drosophila ficusphila]
MDNNVEQTAAKSQTADSTTTVIAAGAGGSGGGSAGPGASGSGQPTPGSNSSTFWKNSGRRVPGRPSPKRETEKSAAVGGAGGRGTAPGSGMVSTFTEYQKSVSDAWDMGDDEFCIISSTEAAAAAAGAGGDAARFSRQVSQTVALNVIETHSRSNQNHNASRLASECAADSTTASRSSADESKEDRRSLPDSNENRSRLRNYPGRPQLQKISSNCQDSEYETKIEKFQVVLDSPQLDLVALKKISWSGVPRKMRAVSWRLLSKYLPPSSERRMAVLESKRQGYQDLRHNYFRVDSQDETQQDTYRQIHIDVPRMNPQIPLFQQQLVQEMFERILFIWAIRHPASGYVQGINDLVTPFFIVFLQEALTPDTDLEKYDMSSLPEESRNIIEADSFWCLSKFLDCIQDNYIFAQLGIQEKVNQLKDLIQRIDVNLHRHLQTHGVDYLQFSFRWMNNLLTRELPLHCTIRLWDTYLAESDGFALFHLYVCAAFLLHWKEQLMQQNDFQGLMLLLQNLPTHNWSDRQINVLLAEAFRLKFTYADAPKHLETKS